MSCPLNQYRYSMPSQSVENAFVTLERFSKDDPLVHSLVGGCKCTTRGMLASPAGRCFPPLGFVFPRGTLCLRWGGMLLKMESMRGRPLSLTLPSSLSERHTTVNPSSSCVSREMVVASSRGRGARNTTTATEQHPFCTEALPETLTPTPALCVLSFVRRNSGENKCIAKILDHINNYLTR